MTAVDSRTLIQAGAAALQRGQATDARAFFERAGEEAPALLGLAIACRALGDSAGKLAALDRLLAVDPRHLRGLIWKGDHFAETGDTRAASAFYASALRNAPPLDSLPAEIAADVRRAQQAVVDATRGYEAHLNAALGDIAASPRFAESIDLMLGRKRIYLQQPRHYYFPGLPQEPFSTVEHPAWLKKLEKAAPAIRKELEALMADPAAFEPYLASQADRPGGDAHGMADNPDWGAIYLIRDGVPNEAVIARCPKTMAAFKGAPLCEIDGRTPSILFSRLAPKAKIPPHHGFINTRLIGHLPLIVPPGCGFRVGNEVREWREGEAWLFDDTIEHEAWNDSDQERVILIFDVWRPELTAIERDMVQRLFGAVDSYGGTRAVWGV